MEKLNESNFITILKANNILLQEDLKINDFKKVKVNFQNVATHYQIATYFRFSKFSKLTLGYIERHFTVVRETPIFYTRLHLSCKRYF